ncbi:hypothetical protein ACQ4PT_035063 [Festuca glaucescens]
MGTGHHEENWGGTNTNFQRSANFNNNNRFGYGGNQQRWNTGRGGGFQNRPRANGTGAAARNGIDADLLQQTVQAVVAAVTAATKITEPLAVKVPQVAVVADDMVAATGQQVGMSVAAPNAISQQPTVTSQGAQDIQGAGAKGKDNEGQGPLKKKKEDKAGCFRCKKPGHYIDDCPTPFCDLCESIHHAAPACHLLNAPKPTTTIHGYANEALMFFELPCGAFKAKAKNPKLAKVTVDGDAMTIPEIIEQLKKIVPSEKFNWEVFHFRDNVFRVKLPSKQEVQRLKNFGTYICTDRESCLTFDLWSSLEEPLYMLPEVWVRVSGLPSDIRSYYLSLWGVGTLFGKTLDVDMAYTRNNKVLRTKIGCLDRNLIPADSDVFIRRGFFKLRFEVETTQGYQEVNMVEANNGNDGNDDAHHGEENNGGGNAMDMDPKGLEEGNTSNNNGQEGSYENNGVDGMQVQSNHIDAIQIGTMNVQITPTDGMLSKSTSGLPLVGGVAGRWVAGRMVQHAPAAAAPPLADNQLHAGQSVPRPMICAQRAEQLVGCHLQAGDQTPGTMCERTRVGPKARSAVAAEMGSRALVVSPTPQKIRRGSAVGPASAMQDSSNHKTMIANDKHMIGADSPGFLGSSVHKLDRGEVWLVRWNNQRMALGESPFWLRKRRRLELDFKSSPNIPAQPTLDEIIAFGGIPKTSTGVRSSARLENRPDVDMPQMEKAMRNAQMREASCSSGYPYGGTLGSALGPPFTGGTAGCHGFWMHTAPDGRSGYLVPGWLATY